jgi:CDP-paratose 2-epimerase
MDQSMHSIFGALIEEISGIKMSHEYIDQNRKGDHICYISDLARMKSDYPHWGP